MIDIDKYLTECVYYPCSGLHGLPIKFLGNRFQRFFYADYGVTREELDNSIREGLKGYQLCMMEELTPEIVFKMSWKSMRNKHSRTFELVHFKWADPFVVLCRLERTSDYGDDHGPAILELMFARCESIAVFVEAFSRRNITPKCLVHIRSGIGFGGNYSEYPQELVSAVLENKGGIPGLILFDRMGGDRGCGDYLCLIEQYKEIVEIMGFPEGDRLTLAQLNITCCDEPLYFSGLTERISESLTDIEWIVLERRIMYDDTLESIGAALGLASAGVRQRESNALEKIIKLFPEVMECFFMKLEKLLMGADGSLMVKECLAAFPDMSETEFNILFAACQKNREGMFFKEEELITLKK